MMDKQVEASVECRQSSRCTGRNGSFPISMIVVTQDGNKANIGFVSKKLRRQINAGAVIGVEDMDALCEKWMSQRKSDVAVDRNKKLADVARRLEAIRRDIEGML